MNMPQSSTAVHNKTTLTVFFEAPFWVGVFERMEGGKMSACKVTFGTEPTDNEIFSFILKHYDSLPFSKPVKAVQRKAADNPKRRSREARKQVESRGIGTKSQQMLKQQYEENKRARKQESKAQRDAQKQRQFNLKQQKRKEKHKGH